MNIERRESITKIIERLNNLKEQIEVLQEEEERYRNNIPETMMDSVRYDKADSAVDYLHTAVSSVEEASEHLQRAIELSDVE